MNIYLDSLELSNSDKIEILELVDFMANEAKGDNLEKIWETMDLVWQKLGCDNRNLNWDKIGQFYIHPVWILNGLFIEPHALSMQHRNAISDWIANNPSISKILDYGGGFGTLARLIADKNPSLLVDIYEPHPSDYSKQKMSDYPQIQFISNIKKKYDVLVSTDVLEHVPDPLKTFEEMILSVKNNGYLVIANNFFPIIKCHLPQTFHLRYTFNVFVKLMGLVIVGPLEKSHATIFRKNSNKPVNWRVVRLLEKVSKGLFPLIELSKPVSKPIYKFVKHEYSSR